MATTLDGWTISTVAQAGLWKGQEMGDVWLQEPGTGQWEQYYFRTRQNATRVARWAQEMTQSQFVEQYSRSRSWRRFSATGEVLVNGDPQQ